MPRQVSLLLVLLSLGGCEQKATPPPPREPTPLPGGPPGPRALSPDEEKSLAEKFTALHGARVSALAADLRWTGKEFGASLRTGADGSIEDLKIDVVPPHAGIAHEFLVLLRDWCPGSCPPLARGNLVVKVLQAVRPARPFAIGVSPDGKRVARVLNDPVAQSVEIYDAVSAERIAVAEIPAVDGEGVGPLASLVFAGPRVLLLGHERRVLFDLDTKQARVLEKGAVWGFQDVSISYDGTNALFCFRPHSFIRGVDPQAKPGSAPPPAPAGGGSAWLRLDVERPAVVPMPKEMPAACDAALSSDGRWIAVHADGLQVWDSRDAKRVLGRPASQCAIQGLAFSRDGKTLSAVEECETGARLLRWTTGTWAPLPAQSLRAKDLFSLRALSADGRLGFVAPSSGDASVVDLARGETLYRFPLQDDRAEVVLLEDEAFVTNKRLNPRSVAVHSLAERRQLWTLSNVPGSTPARAAAPAPK